MTLTSLEVAQTRKMRKLRQPKIEKYESSIFVIKTEDPNCTTFESHRRLVICILSLFTSLQLLLVQVFNFYQLGIILD